MSTILFVDPACPRPYGADLDGQRVRGLGGTEGTVARLTTELARTDGVIVAQHNRERAEMSGGVEFVAASQLHRDLQPDAVVVLRRPRQLRVVKRLFPHARSFLWMHDWYVAPPYWFMHPLKQARHLGLLRSLLATDSTLVCVSAAHLANIEAFVRRSLFRGESLLDQVRKTYIYNVVAVPEHLRDSATSMSAARCRIWNCTFPFTSRQT